MPREAGQTLVPALETLAGELDRLGDELTARFGGLPTISDLVNAGDVGPTGWLSPSSARPAGPAKQLEPPPAAWTRLSVLGTLRKHLHQLLRHCRLELVERARPRVAVVSAGAGNPYGHPAPATLERLGAVARETYRTDRDGPVEHRIVPEVHHAHPAVTQAVAYLEWADELR